MSRRRSALALTMAANYVGLAAVSVAGILLARALGDSGRGHYAAIVAWQGVALTLGEIGQSAALTYYISRRRESLISNVRRSRQIMLAGSAIVFAMAVALAPVLAGGSDYVTHAYRVAFAAVVVNGVFAPFLFSFQGWSLSIWNFLRSLQPMFNLATVGVLFWIGNLTLLSAAYSLLMSTTCQFMVAALLYRRASRAWRGGKAPADQMLSYGGKYAGSAVPAILASNLDRLFLSQAVSAAQLGQYAVAQSVMSLATPVGNAIASVAFPSFAARKNDEGRLRAEFAVLAQALLGVAPAVVALLVLSPWLIPVVFGREFEAAIELSGWIAPAVVAQGVLAVAGAILRGRGRPGTAGLISTLSLFAATAAMMSAVPWLGVRGAAVGSCVGSVVGIVSISVVLFLETRSRGCAAHGGEGSASS